MDFHSGSGSKESACNAGDLGSIPGLGRSPGRGHGNPLQYPCLENPHGQRRLVSCSLWGCKESDMTEQLSMGQHINIYSTWTWASLVAQLVRNLPAMRETWVRPLGWEDPLEDGMAIHSNILAWRIPMDRGDWWATVHRVANSQT